MSLGGAPPLLAHQSFAPESRASHQTRKRGSHFPGQPGSRGVPLVGSVWDRQRRGTITLRDGAYPVVKTSYNTMVSVLSSTRKEQFFAFLNHAEGLPVDEFGILTEEFTQRAGGHIDHVMA
jgi:hypothetical protein